MNRRPLAAAVLVAMTVLGVGIALALRAPGPGVPRPLTGSTQVRGLSVSIPRGFRDYKLPFDAFNAGPVGHVLANFRLPARPPRGWPSTIEWLLNRWSAAQSKFIALRKHNYGPPSNAVALELTPAAGRWTCRFTCPPIRLHLPLDPNQPWEQERLASGASGYRFGYLRFHHQLYYVLYWIGPDAPANDRAAVLAALRSIRPA